MSLTTSNLKSTLQPIITQSSNQNKNRILPLKKTLLFKKHLNLLNNSNLILFLRPGNFNSFEWNKLRSSLSDIIATTSPVTTTTTTTLIEEPTKLKLINLRPGLLTSLLKSKELNKNLDTSNLELNSHLKGPLTILTSNNLNPNELIKILKLLNNFSLLPAANSPPIDLKSKLPIIKLERLKFLSSLIDLKSFNVEKTKEISNLPSLEILRSQIIGLLNSPSSRITGLLSNPSMRLLNSLKGFEEGLKPVVESKKEDEVVV